MKSYLLITLSFLAIGNISGQDPEAGSILKKLSEKYQKMKSVELTFTMDIKYPNESPVRSHCRMVQKSNKYFFIGNDQEVYCDGKSVWLYLKTRNEVQINNYEGQDDEQLIMTPLDLVKQYDSNRFSYALSAQNGEIVHIEFKPNDRNSDYSKFRIQVHTKNNEIKQVEAFSKDGSSVVINLKSPVSNKTYTDKEFVFNPSKYPGVHVEDLRID